MVELTKEEKEMREAIIAKLKIRKKILPSELAEELKATPQQMERILQSLLDLGIAGPERVQRSQKR